MFFSPIAVRTRKPELRQGTLIRATPHQCRVNEKCREGWLKIICRCHACRRCWEDRVIVSGSHTWKLSRSLLDWFSKSNKCLIFKKKTYSDVTNAKMREESHLDTLLYPSLIRGRTSFSVSHNSSWGPGKDGWWRISGEGADGSYSLGKIHITLPSFSWGLGLSFFSITSLRLNWRRPGLTWVTHGPSLCPLGTCYAGLLRGLEHQAFSSYKFFL